MKSIEGSANDAVSDPEHWLFILLKANLIVLALIYWGSLSLYETQTINRLCVPIGARQRYDKPVLLSLCVFTAVHTLY